jgi:23S rRNA pseudouridine2605 synthase
MFEEGNWLRLNRFLAMGGIASRRKCDEIIASGLVKINGKVVKELGIKVSSKDKVTVNGKIVHIREKKVYIVLNKPNDYITTAKDEKGRKTVLDLVKINERIFPIGRLDRKTVGVLLLTNDGELANKLMHPKYLIEKEYKVKLNKSINKNDMKKVVSGINLEDGSASASEIYLGMNESEVFVTVHEGRNHLVRRMFEKLGYSVEKLERIRYASIISHGLNRGDWRNLKSSEVLTLKELVKMV